MKSEEDLNEEAHDALLKDHADLTDIREKYLEAIELLKVEESGLLMFMTQNIVLGLEGALMNLDNLINCYVNQTVKERKNEPIN